MRKSRMGKHNFCQKTALSLIFISLGCFLLLFGFHRQIGPNIDSVSRLKAKGMITKIISETISEELSGSEYEENLFLIRTGEDGKIQMVQSNTALINGLVADFTAMLQEKYDSLQPEIVKVSYGTLMGSKILSEIDFLYAKVKILPLSVSKCDFETEFEGQGINQTKYKIYIVIETSVRVLQPFSSENLKITNKMLISEVVIVGEVPGSYVNVPEEDILDVT